MNNTLAWVLPAEIPHAQSIFPGPAAEFLREGLFPPVLTALILVIISCWGKLEIGLGWWVSAEWITSISPLGGPHTDKVRKNGFGIRLSIHGFLVEKWNFPTEGASVPAVSVHSMFHLLLLFWKCNYLRYRGLNGDSLAGERFHLPKASSDGVFSCVPILSSPSCSFFFFFSTCQLENKLFTYSSSLSNEKVNIFKSRIHFLLSFHCGSNFFIFQKH